MRNPRRRTQLDAALLVLVALLLLAIALPPLGAARPVLALGACLLLPGGALLTLIPVRDLFTWFLVAVLTSLAIGTITSLLMLWVGAWHPLVLAGVLGAASAVLLGLDLYRARSGGSSLRAPGLRRRGRSSAQPAPAQH